MASVSNEGLASESMKKRLSENGYHSSFLDIIPKYKVRKVSAVRDFPPGCHGTISPKVDLNHEQNTVVSTKEDLGNTLLVDGVKDSNCDAESLSVEVVDSLVNLEEQEKLDRLVGEVVAASMSKTENGVEEKTSDYKSSGLELSRDLKNHDIELPKEMKDIQGDTSVKGADEESLPLVENVGGVTNAPSSVGEENTSVPPQQLIGFMEHTSFLPNDKYRKRKVSAVRDFPAFCGPNAPKPAELSCGDVAEEIKDVAGSDKAVIKHDEVMKTPIDVMDCGALQEMMIESEVADYLREKDTASLNDDALEKTIMVHNEEQETDQVGSSKVERTAVMQETMTKKETDSEEQTIMVHNEEHETDRDGSSKVEKTVVMLETMTKKETDAEIVGEETIVYPANGSEKSTSASSTLGSGNETVRPITQVSQTYHSRKQGKQKKSFDDPGSGNEIVVSQAKHNQTKTAVSAFGSGHETVKPIVQGLMAEPYCPWRQGKQTSLDCAVNENQVEKPIESWRKKAKAVARKSIPSSKKKLASVDDDIDGFSGASAVVDDEGSSLQASRDDGACGLNRKAMNEDSPVEQGNRELAVAVPPFGPNSSSHGDARSKVRETLRLFQVLCRKLLQEEESKSKPEEVKSRQAIRIDLQAAKIIKTKGKEVNTGQHIVGEVPGVEVGDEFQYRVELAIVGVHRLYQAGIDYMKKKGGMLIATSIVSSGGYDDDMEDADVLIYSGQGGNATGKDKTPGDQKLERGNLALKNSISVRNPVRVIRGSKETKSSESADGKVKIVTTYVYDGLYQVENYWTEKSSKGSMVFMFKLVRIPGQPELAWKEVKSSRKSKVRHGVCVHDITEGKETLPICAVNIIDGEKPPPFTYTKKMIYPDWFNLSPPKGCDCVGRCSDSIKCSCAVKNGGELPYNRNGAIVEVKPLVYECGPFCKCPPTCYNRVSQHGIKIPLEIFKTNSRGWGVRAVTSIPSGTFICEYAGELLEDKEAERRIGSDEYLFDIGQNYSDCSVNPSGQAELNEVVEEGGYTIDAAHYGNVGRFINHSCSPNLYAQNVLYDHEDKKMPHIMLFAADNIPPLKELTYHYNYSVDQVHDSNGNIKEKKCFCGSSECTGRMY